MELLGLVLVIGGLSCYVFWRHEHRERVSKVERPNAPTPPGTTVENKSTNPYYASALRQRRQYLQDTRAEKARKAAIIAERAREEQRLRLVAEARQHACRVVDDAMAGLADEIPKIMAAAAERDWNQHFVPLVSEDVLRQWRYHSKKGEEASEPIETLVTIAAAESAEYQRLLRVCRELGYEVRFENLNKSMGLRVSF